MTLNRHASPDWDGETAAVAGESRGGGALAHTCYFLLFLVGATLVFGVLAVRTAGFRELAAARILDWTQTRVGIRGSRMVWPYDVALKDLTVPVNPGRERPGLFVPELRVGWRPFRGLEIRMIRPYARLVRGADGNWNPEELGLLGQIRNAGDMVDWLAPVQGRASVRILRGTLEVATPDGVTERRLESIDLDAVPVVLPGRRAVHFRLRTGPMFGGEGRYRSLGAEWLAIEGAGVRELVFDVDSGGTPWGRDFWKGVQP